MVPAASLKNAGRIEKFDSMKRVAKKDNPAEYEALAREAKERNKLAERHTQFRDETGNLISKEEFVALPKYKRDKVKVFIWKSRPNNPQASKAGTGYATGCFNCGEPHEMK